VLLAAIRSGTYPALAGAATSSDYFYQEILMTFRFSLLLAVSFIALQGCDRSRAPTLTDPVPPAPPPIEHRIDVVRTSGVEGLPAAGSLTVEEGAVVEYSFVPASGFGDLQVLLDTLPLPSAGSFRVDTSRVLRVVAWPVPQPPTSALGEAVGQIYAAGSADALREVMNRVREATLAGDDGLLDEIRRAEYFALLTQGPEGLLRMLEALAGQSVSLAGTGEGTANSRFSIGSDGALFAQDTVVPTTIILVNGVLNTRGMATGSAETLLRVVREAGFDRASYDAAAGGARPGSSLQIYLHFNPIVSLQSPIESCALTAAWALNVGGLADPDAGDRSLFERAWDALRRLPRVTACNNFFSTNLRVVEQLLDANLGGLSRPDVRDERLVSLIDSERARSGGRSVLVVGHSHGSVIARTAVGVAGGRREHTGCLGALALGSPLSTTLAWPNQEWLTRIIARGQVSGSHDFFYPFGPGRTDGRSSALTARLDADLQESGSWRVPPVLRQLQLHALEDSYLATDGHRSQVITALRAGYGALADACGGTLTGEVRDFGTGQVVAGANVSLRSAGRERAEVKTDATGRFRTPTLRPVLHDLIVSAEGYRPDTLPQRLVPFDATVPVQQGPIYIGRDCDRESSGNCDLSGAYAGYYHLSGSRQGIPVACSFQSVIHLVQTGETLRGTVSTDRYQRGCDAGGSFIHWGQGVWDVSGTIVGDRIILAHPAIPPWTLTGRAYAGGFQVTEPEWLPGDFRLRVEIAARRTGDAEAGEQDVRRPANVGPSPSVGSGTR
jgi:hypothetical protein